jgi:uncharacterized protein DUF3306
MSEPDNFLSRWSRRKLEPAQPGDEAVTPQSGQADETKERAPTSQEADPAPAQPQEPALDLASLPPIESITAGTDIRDFLKPGVPLSLSRAALRRAWTSDPAIRDFIGIAENQWDFTAPDSMPGFGPIDPEDVKRLLAHMVGPGQSADAPAALPGAESDAPQPPPPETATRRDETPAPGVSQNAAAAQVKDESASVEAERDTSQRNKENDALQKNGQPDTELSYAELRQGHGSALPR